MSRSKIVRVDEIREIIYKITPALNNEADKPLHICYVFEVYCLFEDNKWIQGWTWTCSCGGKGRPQFQSDGSSVFAFFRHAYRAEGIMWPKDTNPQHPGYRWLRQMQS